MFHKSLVRTSGGDISSEVMQKIDLMLDEFINITNSICVNNQYRRAIIRSNLDCNLIIVLDRKILHIAAIKTISTPSTISLNKQNEEFKPEQIIEAAIWEFGYEDPFYISFERELIDQDTNLRKNRLEYIAKEYVNNELQRYIKMTNLIKINPIFGQANYNIDNNLVFVLMPFTNPELNDIYNGIIKPTVEESMACRRADDFKTNKAIMHDIWKAICEARIIIADLTDFNPNVMYELGIAHTLGKETILIYQKNKSIETKFPFDLSHIRRIEYENNITATDKLRDDLRDTIKNILMPVTL